MKPKPSYLGAFIGLFVLLYFLTPVLLLKGLSLAGVSQSGIYRISETAYYPVGLLSGRWKLYERFIDQQLSWFF